MSCNLCLMLRNLWLWPTRCRLAELSRSASCSLAGCFLTSTLCDRPPSACPEHSALGSTHPLWPSFRGLPSPPWLQSCLERQQCVDDVGVLDALHCWGGVQGSKSYRGGMALRPFLPSIQVGVSWAMSIQGDGRSGRPFHSLLGTSRAQCSYNKSLIPLGLCSAFLLASLRLLDPHV